MEGADGTGSISAPAGVCFLSTEFLPAVCLSAANRSGKQAFPLLVSKATVY